MIVVTGSVNLDFVVRTTSLPRPGETVLGTELLITPGGKGANQALAARRAGEDVRLIAAVGQDAWSDSALRILKDEGVDLQAVMHVSENTGMAFVQVDTSGENAITVFSGANFSSGAHADAIEKLKLGHSDVVLCQLEIGADEVEAALSKARLAGSCSILNAAPLTSQARSLARLADIVICNETEFEELCGMTFASSEARRDAMADFGRNNGGSIIVTLGAAGAEGFHDDRSYSTPGIMIAPVDTVGAGDTFCGFFAASLSRGDTFGIALQRAVIAGSLACLQHGAQEAIPYAHSVDAVLKSLPEAREFR